MIRYGFVDTPLGVALLAASERGLCALRLCGATEEGKAAQLADVRAEHAGAAFAECIDAVQADADALLAFLSGTADDFRPVLDVRLGTDFQRAVWDELRRIPPGETITYTELAAQVGRPAAVRAAAGACARNGIAIAVPCHRVLRADGTITGFRWRPDAKRRLLDLEAAAQRRRANGKERL